MKKFLIFLIGIAVLFLPAKVLAGGILDLRTIISSLANIFSYNNLVSNYAYVPPVTTDEWTQFGHDAQRTSYTPQTVATTWRYKWQWNGADANAKPQTSHLNAPDFVQPITGGNYVYMVAGDTIFALDKAGNSDKTGKEVWRNNSLGTINSTSVYDSGNLYVAGASKLYKLNALTGAVIASFTSASALNLSPLLAGGTLYVVSSGGVLYAINPADMTQKWAYSGGSTGSTPPAYSPSRNAVVFLTQDLNVHTVNVANGSLKWKVKPTPRVYQCKTITGSSDSCNVDVNGAQAEEGWPVIAEQHGVVFVRYRLDWDALWVFSPYKTTNAAIRTDLLSRPDQQSVFALNLDDGSVKFIPAVGNGGAGDGGTSPMGPQPVVKVINGQEIAYIIWRNGLTCASIGYCDGRNDATFGEMVLDSTTVSGYTAGDMRFVGNRVYSSGNNNIQTDEMRYLTMSGDILFHGHWLVSQNNRIGNRSASFGDTFTNSILTTPVFDIIWRQVSGQGCTFDSLSRFCSNHLYSYGDTRYYDSPGFYEYWDSSQGGGLPFTVVSGGLVLVKTPDGAIMAFENGVSTTSLPQSLASANQGPAVLGAASIEYTQAKNYFNQTVTAIGVIKSAVNHLPKAIYLGFTNPHDGALLVRIFNKDIFKFNYDPMTLLNKKIKVTGKVTLYWPENIDPEIIVTDPSQIQIVP